MNLFRSILLLSSAIILLSACGQKGPLYLPTHGKTSTPESKEQK